MSLDIRYSNIDNYIYLYHVDKFILIPSFPESVTDNLSASFSSETPLMRSAPIYSYSGSGPRSIQVEFSLHREMMQEINYGASTLNLSMPSNDDYVDYMIKAIQAAALPSYESALKMVNPPMVALRLGNDIFIKGVITGTVGVTYSYPILENGKYASVKLAIGVNEVDPYQASDVLQYGSYRGVSTTLERYTYGDTLPSKSTSYYNSLTGTWLSR